MIWFITTFPIIIYLILIASLIALAVSFFLPSLYKTPVTVISSVLFCFSIYSLGAIHSDANNKKEVARLSEQVKIAEQKAEEASSAVEIKVVEKVKYVKGKTEYVVTKVPVYITKEVDRMYPLPNSFVVLHDAAARSEIPSSSRDSIEGTSDVKISEATRTVAENYGTCNEIREQLIGWQQWYKKQKQIHESIK